MKIKKRQIRYRYIHFFTAFLTCLFLTACAIPLPDKPVDQHIFTGFYFDTFVQITVYGEFPEETSEGLKEMLEKYDMLFSESSDDGILADINSDATEIILDDESAYLVQFLLDGAALTDGLFDPTIYPASKLWDFGSDTGVVPDEKLISDAVLKCDYKSLHLNGNTLAKDDPDIMLSFGAVAKGYIADKTASYLKENGIDNALINLGGNVYCLGSKNGLEKYNIGIKKPFSDNEAVTSVSVSNGMSVVTTGIYERYFESDGVIYHHILDTETGYPVMNGLASATVIGPESLICDFLSTAYFVSYGNSAVTDRLKDTYPEYEVIYVSAKGEIIK